MFYSSSMKDHIESFSGVHESLFALNHIHKSISAVFNNCIRVFKSLPFTTGLVSSAYIIAKNMSDTLQMSFMYKINKRGPSIEPWRTPH